MGVDNKVPKKSPSQRVQHNVRDATDTVLPAGLGFAELPCFWEEKKKSFFLQPNAFPSHIRLLACLFLPATPLFGVDVKSCVLWYKRLMGVTTLGAGYHP